MECLYGDTKYRLLFHIAVNDVKPILSLPDCEQIVDISPICNNADIFNDYSDLFDGKLGSLPVKYHIKINPTVKPVVHPPRRVPVAMR